MASSLRATVVVSPQFSAASHYMRRSRGEQEGLSETVLYMQDLWDRADLWGCRCDAHIYILIWVHAAPQGSIFINIKAASRLWVIVPHLTEKVLIFLFFHKWAYESQTLRVGLEFWGDVTCRQHLWSFASVQARVWICNPNRKSLSHKSRQIFILRLTPAWDYTGKANLNAR